MIIVFLLLVVFHTECALLQWFLLSHHHNFSGFMSGRTYAPVLKVIRVDGHGPTLS